jgi:hypothetical protein
MFSTGKISANISDKCKCKDCVSRYGRHAKQSSQSEFRIFSVLYSSNLVRGKVISMFVNRVLLHTTKREKYLQYGRLDKVQLYTYNISLVST